MRENLCWTFTIIFTAVFLALGLWATYHRGREKKQPKTIWTVLAFMYFLVMFQMYLVYMYPPPGEEPLTPCWMPDIFDPKK